MIYTKGPKTSSFTKSRSFRSLAGGYRHSIPNRTLPRPAARDPPLPPPSPSVATWPDGGPERAPLGAAPLSRNRALPRSIPSLFTVKDPCSLASNSRARRRCLLYHPPRDPVNHRRRRIQAPARPGRRGQGPGAAPVPSAVVLLSWARRFSPAVRPQGAR